MSPDRSWQVTDRQMYPTVYILTNEQVKNTSEHSLLCIYRVFGDIDVTDAYLLMKNHHVIDKILDTFFIINSLVPSVLA